MPNPMIPPIPAKLVSDGEPDEERLEDENLDDDEGADDQTTIDRDVAEADKANERLSE